MTNTSAAAKTMTQTWQPLCHRDDLVHFYGVAAWIETDEGPAQVAIFYIPAGANTPGEADHECELFALDHHDPFANANVIARGIVGDFEGEPMVASPIYKQHFRLADGQCLENDDVKLRTWPVSFEDDQVMIQA